MNINGNGTLPAGSPSQSLTRARFLLTFVDQSIQSVLTMAQAGMVTVPETTLLAWQTVLATAARLLRTLPVPAIFPPPRWAQLASEAAMLTEQAQQILAAIPVASTRIFPPQPGTATVQTQVLRQVQVLVRRAAQLVLNAENELGAQ